MANIQTYSNIAVYANDNLLAEIYYVDVYEPGMITIKSRVPQAGIEFDPKIGDKVKLNIFYGSDEHTFDNAKLMSKQIHMEICDKPEIFLSGEVKTKNKLLSWLLSKFLSFSGQIRNLKDESLSQTLTFNMESK